MILMFNKHLFLYIIIQCIGLCQISPFASIYVGDNKIFKISWYFTPEFEYFLYRLNNFRVLFFLCCLYLLTLRM